MKAWPLLSGSTQFYRETTSVNCHDMLGSVTEAHATYHVIRQVGSVISFSSLEEEHNCSISSKVNLNSPGGERQPRLQEKQATLDQKWGCFLLSLHFSVCCDLTTHFSFMIEWNQRHFSCYVQWTLLYPLSTFLSPSSLVTLSLLILRMLLWCFSRFSGYAFLRPLTVSSSSNFSACHYSPYRLPLALFPPTFPMP